MATVRKKISELTALNSASLDTTLLGVDNGTTYKIELDTLADAVTSRVNILDRSRLSALETFTSSVSLTIPANTISSSTQITNLGFISTSVDITSLNSFTASQSGINTAFTNGINSRLTTSSFESFSSSVHTQLLAATNEQSFNGLISGSSQLTSSYDTRYVISGSITQTTWDNIANKPGGIVSSSIQILGSSGIISSSTNLVTTLSFNSYTASISTASLVSSITNLNTFTSSNANTSLNVFTGSVVLTSSFNSYTASQSTSSLVNRLNVIESVTSSYEIRGNGIISGSSQLTSSFDTRYTLSGSVQPLPSNLISSSAQITTFGFVSGSYETTGRGIYSSSIQLPIGLISGSSQLTASYDTRYAASGSSVSLPAGVVSGSIQVLGSSGVYSSSVQLPSGLISGSSQLPLGLVSGSSQLTTSLDTRYAASGSMGGAAPAGTVSGSSQLTSSFDGRYIQTGSYNLYTSSINTYTSSLNIWTSSIATTGSNSFNGNQIVTGSLTVSSVAVISSSFTANSSSLTLNSGSNFYLQNNGIAQITGSLNVSGSTTFTGSISISSGSITMPNRPAFRVYGLGGATTATTVLSGSMTIVDYNQGGWDNTTGTFTAPIVGLYQVNLVVRTNSNSSAQSVQVIVYKNYTGLGTGTAQIMVEWAANTTANHIGGSTISKLAAGDTLRAVVSVGTASFDANDNFSVAYIG